MTEMAFAKSFLSALDAHPIRVPEDHVEDPRNYMPRPAYTLPKMPKPMSKRSPSTLAPGQERSLAVSVKSLRNPPLDVRLASQSLNTSVLDIKSHVTRETGIPEDRMKILHRKKPVPDSKVLKDLVGDGETRVELSVMVMGGAAAAAAVKPAAETAAPTEEAQKDNVAAQGSGPSGSDVLQTGEFWDDLKGFLLQRVRDEALTEELTDTFRTAWKGKGRA